MNLIGEQITPLKVMTHEKIKTLRDSLIMAKSNGQTVNRASLLTSVEFMITDKLIASEKWSDKWIKFQDGEPVLDDDGNVVYVDHWSTWSDETLFNSLLRISLTFQSSSSFALNSAKFHIFLNSNSHFYELIKRDSDNAILQDKSIEGNVDDTPGDVSSDSDNDDEDINDPSIVQKEDTKESCDDLEVLDEDELDDSDDGNDDNRDDDENIKQFLGDDSTLYDNSASTSKLNKESQQENLSNLIGQAWSEYVEKCPSFDDIQKKLLVNGTSRAASLRANGTHHTSFQRQLLAQFVSPLSRSPQQALWLDPEFVLTLRGQLILATPDANPNNSDSPSPEHYNRGLKLICPSGTSTIVKAIVTALVQSVNADFVIINRRTIDSVRYKVSQQHDIPSESLSTAAIVQSLFKFLHKSDVRSVVCLQDEMKWFVRQSGVSQLFTSELQQSRSNVFLLHVDPEPPLAFGYSPSEARAKQQGPSVASLSQDQSAGGNPQFSFPFSPQSFPNTEGNKQQSSNKMNTNLKPSSSTSSSGGPHPNQLSNQMPVTIGQSFQITIKNGSASISPIPSIVPPGSMPPGMPPGMMPGMMPFPGMVPPGMTPFGMMPPGMMPPGGAIGGGMPNPPDALMRKIVEHRQKKQREGVNEEDLGLTEEDMRMFMSDPSNRAAMQDFLDNVMKMARSQLPPGALDAAPAGEDIDDRPTVEVKVHMMSVPMMAPMNPGSMPPIAPVPAEKANDKQRTSSSIAAAVDKSNKPPSTQSRFPGIFFKPKDKEKSTKKQKDESKGLGKATATVRAATAVPLSPSLDEGNESSSSREDRPTRVSEAEVARELDSLSAFFPEMVVAAPRDHSLKVLWDRMGDEEMEKKVSKLNRKLIEKELKRTKTKLRHLPTRSSKEHSKSVLHSVTLTDVLSNRVLVPDEVTKAVQSAKLFQAGLGGGNQLSPQNASEERKEEEEELLVSLWAMDAGLCSVLGHPIPKLGRTATRSLEDLFAGITDKHERALLPNVISPADVGVSYDMIGGLNDVKLALQQCITYPLKYPRLYQEGVAAEGIKGVMLFGPPGTGKTMLAKAVATEGGATFLSIDPSTIENKWLGESEKNARAVFTLARKLAPCVIYLDEVDSLLSSREGGDESSHGTLTSVKTTLMQEWDGLRTTKDRVVVIASTNRPFDLDEAVLRRLPRRILVDLPDAHTREEILMVTLAGNRLANDVNLTKIAAQLEGYTGSDIKEICREAVVRVCHERARIEEGLEQAQHTSADLQLIDTDFDAPLRPVNAADFAVAMKKLKASVSETSRENERVTEWNERFGEVKSGKRATKNRRLNMYV